MAKEVVWSKIIMETFFEESGINDRIKLGDTFLDYFYTFYKVEKYFMD